MIQETKTYRCRVCDSENIVKNGTNRCGNQQYWCKDCGARRVLKPKRKHPVEKKVMVSKLVDEAPLKIDEETLSDMITIDGVKYILSDDSWLLIRPSGTEPVLRVYAEGRSQEMVDALLAYGEKIAESVT